MTNTSTAPSAKRWSNPFLVMVAVALFAFVETFSLLSPVYLSFLLTLLISLALNPVVNKLRALTGGRKAATALVVLAMLSIIGLSGWAFFNPIRESVANLAAELPEYWERLQKPLIKMEQHAQRTEVRMQAEVNNEVTRDADIIDSSDRIRPSEITPSTSPKPPANIRSSMAEMLKGIVGNFTKVAFNGAQILIVLGTVFFCVIFTLMNPRPIIGLFFSLVPTRHQDTAFVIMHRICKFAPAWGGSTLAGMLSIGLLVFFLMWPILGIMDAIVLGLIAGLLESIPFLGPTLSTIPALLLALGEGGMTPLWVLLVYVGIQALENNVILPLIMARGMKLHAVAIIFSMLICVAAFGVLGVLVAAPLVAIASIFHEELYRKQFLPTLTDADLDKLAKRVLHEKGVASD